MAANLGYEIPPHLYSGFIPAYMNTCAHTKAHTHIYSSKDWTVNETLPYTTSHGMTHKYFTQQAIAILHDNMI